MTHKNPLRDLHRFGVSVWYDYVSRSLISSPIHFSSARQCGHCLSCSARSNTTRSRFNDFGSRCRPWPCRR